MKWRESEEERRPQESFRRSAMTKHIDQLPLASVYLAIELIEFDPDDKPREVGPCFDQEYWRRKWRTREKARAIIEERRKWPAELFVWKLMCEVRYFHRGMGRIPPWCDERNWTQAQRDQHLLEEQAWESRCKAVLSGWFISDGGRRDEDALDAQAPHPLHLHFSWARKRQTLPASMRLERPSLHRLRGSLHRRKGK